METGVGDDSPSEQEFRFQTIGEKLKAERERLELSLSDLAAKTRVPMRHLDSIEKSDFGALPGTTYTLGFARSYANAMGMDAAKVSTDLRAELAQGGHEGYQAPTQNYEPTDPARIPSRTLAWTAAALGVIAVAAYLIWRSMALQTPLEVVAPVTTGQSSQVVAAPTTPLPVGGTVVLTATDNVWVKIYDETNKRLYENEMKAGDSFTVPPDANKPMIVTGRPQMLKVTVSGTVIAPLGDADKTIADVELTAEALLTRQGSAAPSTGNAPNQPFG